MAHPTEEELLILNSIIYTDDFTNLNVQDRKRSVLDWANQFDLNSIDNDNKPGEISQSEFQTIINTIQNNPDVYQNMIIKDIDNSQYANESGSQRVTNAAISYGDDLIVVYKGTAGDMEWRDNGEGGYSNVADTKQQQMALTYFDEMMAKFNANGNHNIYVTGHSKGGNKAQYIGVLRGDMLEQVYAFDGQGFGQAFLNKYREQIRQNNGKITNISNEYDFVNILLFPIAGDRRYIQSSTNWGIMDGSSSGIGAMFLHKFGAWHSPYSMFTQDNNGNLQLNHKVDQSDLMNQVQGLFAHYAKYMREEDWRYLCYSIMSMMQSGDIPYGDDYSEMPVGFEERLLALTKGYLQKNKGINEQEIFWFISGLFGYDSPAGWITAIGAAVAFSQVSADGYTDRVRDFTTATKDQLLATVQEVEDEPWWDVTKWDVFYRVDKYLLGGVDFPANGEELNTYYRKIIDMQDVSAEEIERIFSDVYNCESSFNTKMEQRKNELDDIMNALTEIHGNIT